MPDLHQALLSEVVASTGRRGEQIILARLQDDRDSSRYSLHLESNTISMSGLQRTEFLQWIGFKGLYECSFVDTKRCFAVEVGDEFNLDAFAEEIWPSYDDASKATRHFEDCGFYFDRAGRPKRNPFGGDGSGDGHRGSEQDRKEEDEDESFQFVFTWLVRGQEKGWVTHYRPKQLPITDELARVIAWLGLRSFDDCPEFGFEHCFWQYTGFVQDGRSLFDSNADVAFRYFRANAEKFSDASGLLLEAEARLNPFGMSLLPNAPVSRGRPDQREVAEPTGPPAARITEGGVESRAVQTVLFTDLVGSTEMHARLGDEAAHKIVRAHDAALRQAISELSGREVKHTGDGIMASFDSPANAVRCALRVRDDIERYNDSHDTEEIQVRFGLNAGEPIAEDNDLFGLSVALAARIGNWGGPGQVLVSDVVRQLLLGKGFGFDLLGEAELKGFDEPVSIYSARSGDS